MTRQGRATVQVKRGSVRPEGIVPHRTARVTRLERPDKYSSIAAESGLGRHLADCQKKKINGLGWLGFPPCLRASV